MLKSLLIDNELTMYQGWIETAIYAFLQNQLECKCHVCKETFLKRNLNFNFYFNNDNKNELRCDLTFDSQTVGQASKPR